MARNAASSRWYIPLFAGTEIVKRSGSLTTTDPDVILGQLPNPCAEPGMILWLDAAASSTVKVMPDTSVYRWNDRSPAGNHAAQPIANLQPHKVGTSVSFED